MAVALNLVTGHTGTPHVTADDAAVLNAAVVGSGNVILDYADKCVGTVSGGKVYVAKGAVSIEGRLIRIPATNMTYANAPQTGTRNDLVIIRYNKEVGGVESAELDIKTGTVGAGDPSVTTGSIANGTLTAEFPLYRLTVTIANTTIERVSTFGVVSGLNAITNAQLTGGITQDKLDRKVYGAKITTPTLIAGDEEYDIPVPMPSGWTQIVAITASSVSIRTEIIFINTSGPGTGATIVAKNRSSVANTLSISYILYGY